LAGKMVNKPKGATVVVTTEKVEIVVPSEKRAVRRKIGTAKLP